ncbi:multiheme c-type cytochrome [Bremerella cremea]|uniref:multiheme c-type cytochrome n=1 Tax=Bremerella cremea TaxID=1031537 RepID=UPI0031EE482B
MPAARKLTSQLAVVTIGLTVIAALWFWGVAPTPVAAIPHVISQPHPYDPDWPEIYLILSQKCSGCHRPDSKRVDLSSYESLLAGKAGKDPLIVPGDPDKSALFLYVEWDEHAKPFSGVSRTPEMPPNKLEWLSPGQLETMKRWITNGALEYCLPENCNITPLTEMEFPSAKQCQACHPKQYDEWSRSMHAYAQHSPVFEAFNLTLMERTNGTQGTFCTRCHTPVGTALGENGNRRNVHRSRISMEGVTCVTCHRRNAKHYKSSGRVGIEPGKMLDTCMYGPFDDASASQAMGAHPSAGQEYLKSSQFCGECHDVTNPQGVRLEEAFSEWQNSPAAKQGITCQQCHMGPVQGVPFKDCERPLGRAAVVPGVPEDQLPLRRLSDHTFAGPDYSLLPDTEFPHRLDWMYEVDYRDFDSLTPYQKETLTELRKQNRYHLRLAAEKRYEVLSKAADLHVQAPQLARPGQKVHVNVEVESLMSGHSFPTGFTAERQAWVSTIVRDQQGRVVFKSGDLDENGDLRDDHSHAVLAGQVPYDQYLLNFQNKFVALTSEGTDRTVILSVNRNLSPLSFVRPATGVSASFGRPETFRIAKGSLAPLTKQRQSYPVRLPNEPGTYHVTVRLNFRHLPPTLLDRIGTPHLKHLLEVVVLREWCGTIEVAP